MSQQIAVEASETEVRQALQAALSPEELSDLGFSESEKARDPFDPGKRGEAITFLTIVIWVGGAAGGGIVGGVAYDVLKKATAALVDQFGKDRVAIQDKN